MNSTSHRLWKGCYIRTEAEKDFDTKCVSEGIFISLAAQFSNRCKVKYKLHGMHLHVGTVIPKEIHLQLSSQEIT